VEVVEVRRKGSLWLRVFMGVGFLILLLSNIFFGYLVMEARIMIAEKNQDIAEKEAAVSMLERENQRLQEEGGKREEVINQLSFDLSAAEEEISQLQTNQVINTETVVNQGKTLPAPNDDSSTSFTIGSSKEHVQKIMGSPDSIILDSWWYGKQSWVRFDSNNRVVSWYDGANFLKTK
jgi:hypothetical protein